MALGRRGAGHLRNLEMRAEINVTSLVDVAFTLLVIFIITAPILQGGVEVAVPRADVQPLTAQDEPFFVSVTPDGRVFVCLLYTSDAADDRRGVLVWVVGGSV